jgi:hypothetical protein
MNATTCRRLLMVVEIALVAALALAMMHYMT